MIVPVLRGARIFAAVVPRPWQAQGAVGPAHRAARRRRGPSGRPDRRRPPCRGHRGIATSLARPTARSWARVLPFLPPIALLAAACNALAEDLCVGRGAGPLARAVGPRAGIGSSPSRSVSATSTGESHQRCSGPRHGRLSAACGESEHRHPGSACPGPSISAQPRLCSRVPRPITTVPGTPWPRKALRSSHPSRVLSSAVLLGSFPKSQTVCLLHRGLLPSPA